MIKRLNYEEIITALAETRNWLITNGVKVEETRLEQYHETINEINQCWKNKTLGQLIAQRGQELYYALVESQAFINIHEAFKDLPAHGKIPTQKLRKIVEGPFLPQDEESDSNTNEGRNLLFELEVAARLKSNGILIQRFDDVDFDFEGTHFNVQCKRLFSDNTNTISANIQKAREQIQTKLTSNDGRGIIALSIEKTKKIDGLILSVREEENIQPRISKDIDEFIKQNERALGQIVDIRIIGVMIFYRFLTVIESQNLLSRGTEVDFLPLCLEGSSNYLLLKKFPQFFSK